LRREIRGPEDHEGYEVWNVENFCFGNKVRDGLFRQGREDGAGASKPPAKEAKADAESKDSWVRTRLISAAANGDLEALEVLVKEAGADVESKDQEGQTPLSWAAYNGHLEAVKFLVKKAGAGADVESKDKDGFTPLSWAAYNGHLEVVKFLAKEADADVESKDSEWGRTPLSWAALNGRLDIVKFLVNEVGADVESRDKDGRTALDLAEGAQESWTWVYREGGKAVAAWLENRITNHGSTANVNDGG